MGAQGQRKCRNCKEFFIPDARNASRQRYCKKSECRAAVKKLLSSNGAIKIRLISAGQLMCSVSRNGVASILVTGRIIWIQMSWGMLMRYKASGKAFWHY